MQKGFWEQQIEIHSYDVDSARRVTIESMLKYFQEAAWHHAERLGLGYSHLRARGHVWLLSRVLLVVDSYPEWTQSALVRTWPRGARSLFALRDFELLDQTGRRAAAATSSWVVYDLRTRRPQRIEPVLQSVPVIPDRQALGGDAPKLPATEGVSEPTTFPVKYSDLDLNDHVNNAAYVRWIIDSYPVDFHRAHKVRSLAVNYLAELDGSDAAELLTSRGDLRFSHTVRRRIDGADACRAELLWQ